MQPYQASGGGDPIVSLDDYGCLLAEAAHQGSRGGNAKGSRESQAEVLVLAVPGEAGNRGLQDVGRGCHAMRDAPAAVLKEQGSLRLCPREAELPHILL